MSDINLKIALESVSQLAADLKRERDEARNVAGGLAEQSLRLRKERDEAAKEALYYKTRYELLKDSINVFAEK